jgi:hypothetical protein
VWACACFVEADSVFMVTGLLVASTYARSSLYDRWNASASRSLRVCRCVHMYVCYVRMNVCVCVDVCVLAGLCMFL